MKTAQDKSREGRRDCETERRVILVDQQDFDPGIDLGQTNSIDLLPIKVRWGIFYTAHQPVTSRFDVKIAAHKSFQR